MNQGISNSNIFLSFLFSQLSNSKGVLWHPQHTAIYDTDSIWNNRKSGSNWKTGYFCIGFMIYLREAICFSDLNSKRILIYLLNICISNWQNHIPYSNQNGRWLRSWCFYVFVINYQVKWYMPDCKLYRTVKCM